MTCIESEETPGDSGIDAAFLEDKQRLLEHAADTRSLLGNAGTSPREKSVVRALLRSLGIPFEESALCISDTEPVDVTFRDAKFQVKSWWDGYKPQLAWQEKETRIAAARSWSDLLEPSDSSVRIDEKSLISMVTSVLQELGWKYGNARSTLDALLYINNKGRHPAIPTTLLADVSALRKQGWRSVSVVFPPVGIVLFVEATAPVFLREMVGSVRAEWPSIDTLFEA